MTLLICLRDLSSRPCTLIIEEKTRINIEDESFDYESNPKPEAEVKGCFMHQRLVS